MSDPLDLRIGDREREAAAERLAQHAAAGRLGVEELELRLERVQAAVHGRDLAAVESDLPSLSPSRPPRRVATRPPVALPALPALPVLLVAAGVALSVAVGHPVVPLFLLALWLWRAAAWRGRRPWLA
jgi:hypothetical protein